MFCRNCGQTVNDKAEICVHCGVRPLSEKKFCQECGAETKSNQELCVKCGVRLRSSLSMSPEGVLVNTNFSGLPIYYQQEFRQINETNEAYKGKWNWPAFFFTWIWALTKGAWAVALIILFVGIPLSLLTFGLIGLGLCIYMGIRGNYIYYNVFTKGKQSPF